MPDITARVLRSCAAGDVVWSEWEMTGTRRDHSVHQMAGVIVFGVRHGRFAWAPGSTWSRCRPGGGRTLDGMAGTAEPMSDGAVIVLQGKLQANGKVLGPGSYYP